MFSKRDRLVDYILFVVLGYRFLKEGYRETFIFFMTFFFLFTSSCELIRTLTRILAQGSFVAFISMNRIVFKYTIFLWAILLVGEAIHTIKEGF